MFEKKYEAEKKYSKIVFNIWKNVLVVLSPYFATIFDWKYS